MHMEPTSPLPGHLIEAATCDLIRARDAALAELNQEAQHRWAIYQATKDPAMASQGAPWAAEIVSSHPEGREGIDKVSILAALSGELGRRMHDADVCICEELYRHMTKEPGLPAWTRRHPDGGLFYVAKVWALAEAAGLDLRPIVCSPFQEAL